MPRIPDAPQPDIGITPTVQPVATPGPTTAENLAGVARALSTLGLAVRDRNRRMNIKEGTNDILVSTAELENETHANFEPADVPEQFSEEYMARTDPIIKRFKDDEIVAQELTLQRNKDLATRLASVRAKSFNELERRLIAATNSLDDQFAARFARTETDAARAVAEEDLRNNIQGLVEAGTISPQQGSLNTIESLGRAHKLRVIELVNQERYTDAEAFLDDSTAKEIIDPETAFRLKNLIEAGSKVDLEELNRDIQGEKTFIDQTGRLSSTFGDTLQRARAAGEDDDVLDLLELQNDVPEIAAITATPIRDQQRKIIQLTEDITTPRQGRFLARLNKASATVQQALRSDPIGFGELRGHIPVQPEIDLGEPETLSEAFKSRDLAARVLEDQFGLPPFSVSGLKKGEIQILENQFDRGAPATSIAILREMLDGLGQERAETVIAQIADQGRPDLAVAADALLDDDQDLARQIMLGNQFLTDRAFAFPVTDMRTVEADELGQLGAFTPGAQESMREAAKRVYATMQAQSGQTEYDESVYRTALRRVAGQNEQGEGGPLIWNDRVTLPPIRGFTEDDLQGLVNIMKPDDLATFGNGVPVKTEIGPDGQAVTVPLNPADINRLVLIHRGGGKYALATMNEGVAMPIPLDTGGPYILNLRKAAQEIMFVPAAVGLPAGFTGVP